MSVFKHVEEATVEKTLSALAQEFGVDQIVIEIPHSWENHLCERARKQLQWRLADTKSLTLRVPNYGIAVGFEVIEEAANVS